MKKPGYWSGEGFLIFDNRDCPNAYSGMLKIHAFFKNLTEFAPNKWLSATIFFSESSGVHGVAWF
jgi:hypothetical protein